MFRWKCLLVVVVHNSRIFSSFTEVACRERHRSVLTSWNKCFTFNAAFSYFGDKKGDYTYQHILDCCYAACILATGIHNSNRDPYWRKVDCIPRWIRNIRSYLEGYQKYFLIVYRMVFDKTRWSFPWNSDENWTQSSGRGGDGGSLGVVEG